MSLLLAAWWWLPEPGWVTLFAVGIAALMPLAAHFAGWLRRPLQQLRAGTAPSPAAAADLPVLRLLQQGLHALACLPFEATYSLAAIARTLWRVLLSKRRLLEWRPSADVSIATEPGTLADLLRNARMLAVAPALAIACAAGLSFVRPDALSVAAPVLLLWLLSPLLVWWFDRPLARTRAALTADQVVFLRRLARRTWSFFELHVTAADHHLPPDNVQEHPVARVAHRTSPTNMGFALLAGLAARDFGYLTTGQLLARLDAALTTMERMPRYRGHFYNWYDTTTLEPLRPRYVSTVDSGNLAAQLITLHSALLALADEPLLPDAWREGVHDTFGVLGESLAADPRKDDAALRDALVRFSRTLLALPQPPARRAARLARDAGRARAGRGARSAARSAPRSRRPTPAPRPRTQRPKAMPRRGPASCWNSAAPVATNCARSAWTSSGARSRRPACRPCGSWPPAATPSTPRAEATRQAARARLAGDRRPRRHAPRR